MEIEIEELVLHGLPASERNVIGDSFRNELEQIFASAEFGAVFRRDVEIPNLDSGRNALPAQKRPASIGAQVARAVYASLNTVHGRENHAG